MITIDYNHKKQKAIITGDHFDLIREHFSVSNPAAKFARSFFVPKRIYSITPTGLFDIGLVGEIVNFLSDRGISEEVVLTESAQKVYSPRFEWDAVYPLKHTLYDYQQEIVTRCIKNGRGTVVLGTGGGKTLTMATLIENYFHNYNKDTFKCLVIVPDVGLVSQTFSDFIEYGVTFSVTKWTGKVVPDLTANVIIANKDILQSKFKDSAWIKYVDLLVVDETHKVRKGNEITKIVQAITTSHKYGFTGTLPEQKEDCWNIIGKMGSILIQKNSHELRSEGRLTDVSVKMLNIKYRNSPEFDYTEEIDFIKQHPFRNKVIKQVCTNFRNNILVIVNHINHGEILTDILKQVTDRQVFFIQGEVEVEERDAVKKIMEQNSNVICVAISSIFSTGINIKNIHMIIIAAGGKSFVRLVQTIGRGLRKHHSKDKLIIIDIADELKYGIAHSLKRIQIYNREKIFYSTKVVEET